MCDKVMLCNVCNKLNSMRLPRAKHYTHDYKIDRNICLKKFTKKSKVNTNSKITRLTFIVEILKGAIVFIHGGKGMIVYHRSICVQRAI